MCGYYWEKLHVNHFWELGLSIKFSEFLVDVPFLAQDQERIGRSNGASIGSHAKELLKSGNKL